MLVDEEMDMDPDQVSNDVGRHGTIAVRVVRGNYVPTQSQKTKSALCADDMVCDTVMSSTAVVKKNNVSHAVK